MTEDEVRTRLREEVEKQPRPLTKKGEPRKGLFGLNAWCREHNVRRGHASEFLNGRRWPQADLLAALGLEWRIVPRSSDQPISTEDDSGR